MKEIDPESVFRVVDGRVEIDAKDLADLIKMDGPLQASIMKWEFVVGYLEKNGPGTITSCGGHKTCGLCVMQDDSFCAGCPVAIKTERPGCRDTPIVEWEECPSIDAARAELKFLRDLAADTAETQAAKREITVCGVNLGGFPNEMLIAIATADQPMKVDTNSSPDEDKRAKAIARELLVERCEKAEREVRALRAGIKSMRKAIRGQGSITEWAARGIPPRLFETEEAARRWIEDNEATLVLLPVRVSVTISEAEPDDGGNRA